MIGGGLFSRYYLDEGIREDAAWAAIPDDQVAAFTATARSCFAKIPATGNVGEAETESLVIFPVLAALGWSYLPQQKAAKRREDIPDALLFADDIAQRHALALPAGIDRWKQASVVNENKAWNLPLDRASGAAARTPASQVLRYLRLAEEHSGGAQKLTNRAHREAAVGWASAHHRWRPLQADGLKPILPESDAAIGARRLSPSAPTRSPAPSPPCPALAR
jgi:hypothetical protein